MISPESTAARLNPSALRSPARAWDGFQILVPSFENILISYTFCDGQVRIVRVLHGKRDIAL